MASSVQISREGARAAAPAVRLTGLGNRLLEVYARRLPRAEVAAEIARLLAEAVRVKAVAVLTYDAHTDRLRLLGDVGLTAEARSALGNGGDCPWDLPLRGLHNRRISVIAAAQDNPFVPRGVVRISPRALTLAALPMFHELKPVGVVLLFAGGHRAFPDAQLQQLSQVLRVCVRGLLEHEGPRPSAPPAETASAEAVIARLVREGAVIEAPELGAVPEPEARPRLDTVVARLLRLENELTETRGELARSEQSLRALSASYTAIARERDGLTQSLEVAEAAQAAAVAALQAQVEALEQRLLAVDSERVRAQRLAETRQDETTRALASLQAERAALVEREEAATRAAAETRAALQVERAEHAAVAARLAEVTAQEAATRQRIEDLETAVAAGREAFDEDRGRLDAALRAAQAAANEQATLVRRLEERLAGETSERDAARDDSAALRQRLAEALQASGEVAAELERQRGTATAAESARAAEVARLQLQLAEEEATRRQIESERDAASSAAAAAAAELAALRATAGSASQQAQELAAQLVAAEAEAAAAARGSAALEAELASSRQQHAAATAAAAREEERTRGLAAALAAAQASCDELRASVAAVETERVALQTESQDVAGRLAAAHQQLIEVTAALAERDEVIAAARAERQRLEEALLGAEASAAELCDERDGLRRQAEEVLAQTGMVELEGAEDLISAGAVGDAEHEHEGDAFMARASQIRRSEERSDVLFDAPLTIERSEPLDVELSEVEEAEDVEVPAGAEAEAPAVGEVVLLDIGARGDDATQVLENVGFSVTRAPLGEGTVDDLARRKVHCVLLNLAGGPAAWQTLKALRERSGTRALPILAYVLQPQATAGFCFGRADFGLWPMDPGRIADGLRRMRPKLKRLLVVSGDVDTTGRIREPLGKAGISTSIVLDGKQALELSTIVAPEAALLHLGPQCLAAARAIAGLRAAEATRDLPMLVALDRNPPREETFLAGAVRDLVARPNFSLANLPGELAALLG